MCESTYIRKPSGKWVLFLFFLLFSCFISAADALIWKVQNPKLPGTLYLAGTVHLGKAEMYPLDQVYDRVLKKADYLVFEIAAPNKLLAMQYTIRNGIYPATSQENLRTLLGETDFKRLEKCISSMPPGSLERMKPWVITSVWEVFQAQKSGFSTVYGVENVFHANRGVRPERSLESDRDQLECISSTDLEAELVAELKDGLNHSEKMDEEIRSVVPALREGKTGVLLRNLREAKQKTPKFYQSLIVNRNKAMAEKLLVMMEKKETGLVLVGAAHFLGNESIITFLRQAGCTSVRLKLTGKPGKLSPNVQATNEADTAVSLEQ